MKKEEKLAEIIRIKTRIQTLEDRIQRKNTTTMEYVRWSRELASLEKRLEKLN